MAAAMSASRPSRRRQPPAQPTNTMAGWLRTARHDWFIVLAMSAGLIVAFIPIFFMASISLKTPGQFLTKPLEITYPFAWDNYVIAFNVLKRSILNTMGMTVVVVV